MSKERALVGVARVDMSRYPLKTKTLGSLTWQGRLNLCHVILSHVKPLSLRSCSECLASASAGTLDTFPCAVSLRCWSLLDDFHPFLAEEVSSLCSEVPISVNNFGTFLRVLSSQKCGGEKLQNLQVGYFFYEEET